MQRPESAAISPFASLISAFPDGSSCHTEVSMSHKVAWLQSWEISSPHPPFKVFFKGLYWTHDRYMSHNLDMEKKTIKTITVLVQVSVLRKGGVANRCTSIPVRWSGFEMEIIIKIAVRSVWCMPYQNMLQRNFLMSHWHLIFYLFFLPLVLLMSCIEVHIVHHH